MRRTFHSLLPLIAIATLQAPSALAQINNVTNDQATPIPGRGHDYITLLSETVDPANGSVSLRMQAPSPGGRKLSIPFGFAYDTAGIHHLITNPNGTPVWALDGVPYVQGGWSYLAPVVSYTYGTKVVSTLGHQSVCAYYTGFVLQDTTGGRHALGIAAAQPYAPGSCVYPATAVPNAGDDYYRAATVPAGTLGDPYAVVADADGTTYTFSCGPTLCAGMIASTIEDRNGNKITSTSNSQGGYTFTDTLGRALISASSFASSSGDTITVSGAPNPYKVTWETVTSNFSTPAQYANGSQGALPSTNTDQRSEISTITLPNGQHYTFLYGTDDPTNSNPYGLLSKIVYPSGGWVKYSYSMISFTDGFDTVLQGSNGGTIDDFIYATPAVTQRTVSFDGANVALQQIFTYVTNWQSGQTTWNTKTTTVTTTDKVMGQSSETDYVYSYVNIASPPNMSGGPGDQVPVEQTVTYKDGSGKVLRTENKTWFDQYELKSQQTVLDNGLTSETDYTYGPGASVTEQDDYDFGSGAPGNLLRKTVRTYQSFNATPIYPNSATIFDRPCQTIVYDGGGNRMDETDYLYDGGTTICGTAGTPSVSSVSNLPSGTHDENNYGASSTAARGNVTTETRQCLQSCTNSVTTYAYDETGQLFSMTDPCGNATCSDMPSGVSHTTTYSYGDNYGSCGGAAPPSGSTNAYLTRITDPLTHVQTFCYGYDDGQLRGSTDPNSQTTTYKYNDSLSRLTEGDYPDGGKTTIAYNDSPYNPSTPSPSVTTTRAMTSSTSLTTLKAYDGLGHAVRGVLTSDPDCSTGDRTDTTYDGLGRAYTVSNPYCSTSDPTYGITTYAYDALGRTTQVAEPDGSKITTSYTGNCTTVTDEAGNARNSCADGLGRLTQVVEDPGASGHRNYETDYQYDGLDDLLCVAQKGTNTGSFTNCASTPASWRARTFAYNSLSHLTSAINPESGTVSYAYDANGNLSSKTSPAPNQDGSPGTGSATVSGSEQSVAPPATAGTGSVTFSGTLESKQVQTQAAAPGKGSVTINGNLQSKQQTNPAKPGTGSVTFSAPGSIQSYTFDPCQGNLPPAPGSCPQTVYNTGSITLTIAGQQFTINYTGDASSDATAMEGQINQNSLYVSATPPSGSTITITAKTSGSGTNYSLSCCTYQWNQGSFNGTPFFSGPNDTASASGSSLTGGVDSSTTTIYDHGSCTVTVNSLPGDSYPWSGSGTSSSSIASGLQNAINGDSNASVTALASGSTVNLTAKTPGSGTNYSLSSSCTYDTSNFSSPSFSTSNSGSALTGGQDAVYNTIYDSGTSTITVKGWPDAVSWNGPNTSFSTVASALISKINGDSGAFVTASQGPITSTSSQVNLTAKTTGANTNYSLLSSNTYDSTDFSGPSFSSSNGSTLTGGLDAGTTTYDSGSVWVTINGTQYSVGYGQSSSPCSLAGALASAVSAGSFANASASGSCTPSSNTVGISVTAKSNGSATNYSLSSGSSTSQSGTFSSPSFSVSVSGSSLTDGTDPGSTTVTATFSYDALNRLTQKSFSDGATPTDKYGYDGVALSGCAVTPPALTDSNPKGRRTAMCDGAGAESWSHDTRGRTLTDLRTTNGVTKSAGYTYNFDGSIATLTYPSSRVVTYTLKSSKTNTAGRMLSAVDSTGPINYATAAAYAPHGALASVTNGANIISTFYFNDRLQPCRISVISSGKTPSNCADSARIGNVLDFTYSFNLGSDNSNVMGITNNRDNTRSQNFTYDSLNRLFTAQTQTSGVTIPNANCWGLTFGYDPWGNLLSSTISGPSGCGEPIPFSLYATNNNQLSTSSNQLAGYCYDAAGNLVLNSTCPIGSFTPAYSYNAASQLTSTAGVNYTYDGDGRRVIKSSGTIYWYGMSSDALDETDLAGDTNKSGFFEYVFFDGHRIARRDYQNNVVYYFSDHLGTSRVVSSSSGAILDDSDFYPFGAERPVSSSSGNHYKFTGKERDTDLDNFGARYDSSQLGRFMSSDQYSSIIVRQGMKAGGLPEAAADSFFNGFLDNPQNWNKYTYALNNPLRFVDPTGAAPQDGHHLFVERETLFQAGTLARDFANAIKTGPLSGNGYPNQPGFNELHQAYNDAVREMLNEAIQEDGPTEGWSLPQWKDFANSILNSQESAIKDFLDELEQYNPGARAALASSIASYRVSAIVVARIVATALVRSLFRILILCVNCDPASQQQLRERVTHRILPPSS